MVKSLRLFKEEDGRDGRDSRDSRDNSETEYHNFVRDLAVVSFVSVVSVVLKPPPYPSTTTPISCQKGATNFIRSETKFLVRRAQLTFIRNTTPISCQKGTTNFIRSKTKFLVRRGHICSIAKEDPLGIVHEVQPEGSYFWDGAKMLPLITRNFTLKLLYPRQTPYNLAAS